jgi:hypothetical protein
LIGKQFTINGFPAVIEFKWSAGDGFGNYVDQYMFVSGLDKFNQTYDLWRAGFFFSQDPTSCSYGLIYEDDVFVQDFRTLTNEQRGTAPCTATMEEVFSGVVRLQLIIDDFGRWVIKQPAGGPFTEQETWFGPGVIGNTAPVGSFLYCEPQNSTVYPAWVIIGNSPPPASFALPNITICQNNNYIFRIEYSMQPITSDFRGKLVAGWNVIVSEIPSQIYLRNFISDPTDAIRVDGADILNGAYFLPSILSKCAPNDFEEEVTLPYTQMIISETSPCFIVEGGDTGTLTARFKYQYNETLKASYFLLEFDVPYVIGTFPFSYGGQMDLDCTAQCIEFKEVQNICFPTYDQVVFKVCHTPQIE